MKKIYLVSILLISGLSCQKGFLDKKPIDTATLESLFADADGLATAVNGIYDVFQGTFWGGAFYLYTPHFDAITEDAILAYPWEGSYSALALGTIVPTSGGIVDWEWNFGYQGIARANAVLAHVDDTKIIIDDSTRLKYKAEARFLRGLIYFELTTYYGGVPLILAPVETIAQSKVPRNTKQEVLNAVYEDLDFAAANLGTLPLNGQYGRPTKQSALGLKSRVQLYQSDWVNAAATAQQVLDLESSGAVGLDANYESLFDGTNKTSNEVLFAIQFKGSSASSADVGEGNGLSTCYGPIGVDNGGGWGSLSYEETMFDAFEMKDGQPITSSPLYDPANPWANRDSRFYWSWFVPGFTTWLGKPYTEANYSGLISALPINTKKWVSPIDLNSSISGNANFIVLRYADVLLMYAEARNESVGPDGNVYAAINKVRTRAQMPNLTPGLNQVQMRIAIMHERKVELSQEGLRYFDLIRWGLAKQLINSNKREVRNWQDFNALLPIPQNEINTNPKLTQNPGYPQ